MKGVLVDLILILFGGGVIFASIGSDTPFCPGTPPWLARLAVFSLLTIVARLWYLSLMADK